MTVGFTSFEWKGEVARTDIPLDVFEQEGHGTGW